MKFLEYMWDLFEKLIFLLFIILGVNFFFSFMRLLDRDSRNTPGVCRILYIDRLEPIITTRWFCPVEEDK